MVFEIGKFIVISLIAVCALFLLRRKKSTIDILDLSYNRYTKKIKLILRNNGFMPLSIDSSLRLVKTTIPCDWRVSPDEEVPYEIQIPMMSGRYNKLKKLYTLIGEGSIVLDANEIRGIIYDPFEDISIGDEVGIDLLYGEGMLTDSMNKTITIRPETIRGLSLFYSEGGHGAGLSIGEILSDNYFLAS